MHYNTQNNTHTHAHLTPIIYHIYNLVFIKLMYKLINNEIVLQLQNNGSIVKILEEEV